MSALDQHRLRLVNSRQNSLVKELRGAFQQARLTDDGYCAIEGIHLIEEAIRSRLRFRAVFFSQSAQARAGRLLAQLSSQVEALLLPDDVFRGAVATDTPLGVAALVRWKEHSLDQVLSSPRPLLVYSAGLQDPGNLGTMIRSAEAFQAAAVLSGPGTVSCFNPKVIRASAGSLFRLPVIQVENCETVVGTMRQKGVKLFASSSHKGKPLPEADLSGSLCLFVGSEGAGLPRELTKQMDDVLYIPHAGRVESLNAAIAASIILYEAARQRSEN